MIRSNVQSIWATLKTSKYLVINAMGITVLTLKLVL